MPGISRNHGQDSTAYMSEAQDDRMMRFSGVVDPQFIQSGNVVSSTQVANARIESRGRGQQDEAQAMSWLSRFFMNVAPF